MRLVSVFSLFSVYINCAFKVKFASSSYGTG